MNLLQLRTAIQAEGYGTDIATQQTSAINMTYREICGMDRWPFLEKQDTSLSTVAGTGAYTLPMTDWRSLDAVRIEQASLQNYLNLDYKDPQAFRDYEQLDRDVSTPFFWSWFNQQLHFYPVPDGVYTVRIDYIYQPPDLAADGDIPVIPVTYHDILVWGAIAYIAYRERDWLGRQFAEERREQMIKRMQEEYLTRQRQSGSHVKKSGYWDTSMPYPFIHQGF